MAELGQPENLGLPANLGLSPAQREDYARDGFLIVRGCFTSDEMIPVRAAFDELEQLAGPLAAALPADADTTAVMHQGAQFVVSPGPRIHRVVWCGAATPELARIGTDPRLLQIAAGVLPHTSFDHLINQAHFKLPGDAVTFPWHQDCVHRRYGTEMWTDVDGDGSFAQLVLAVDPVSADNGPLSFVPGSHRGGPRKPDSNGTLESIDPNTAISPALEPGDVVVFGPYMIHGSGPNTSTGPRRVLINGFASPGANRRVYPGEGAGQRVHVPPRNEPQEAA
ncbi:MAG: phytanoyl-CoA dioxygenase family protein [Myxococcales bacterium]|nr:phytanoyl-CoA dioxygenase family protein [Myxococcales bacterium]